MSIWLLSAIMGHLANAGAFVIDKLLLTKTWRVSATYAAMIGLMSGLVVVAIPWVRIWPHGAAAVWSTLFGALFVLAIWSFFTALQKSEPSRVVPIVGSLIPIFTLFGSLIWLNDTLTQRSVFGVLILALATWFLAYDSDDRRITRRTWQMALMAAALFAIAALAGKHAFNLSSDDLGVFVFSRLFAMIVGIGLLALPKVRRELFATSKIKAPARNWRAWTLMFLGQGLGALGFMLVSYALAQGNVAVVSALQAVQYAALVCVAWFGGMRLRAALGERVTRKIIVQKLLALAVMAIGLWCLTSSL